MAYDVFISYSRKDSAIADKICKAFDNAGITYFIDRQGVGGGFEFPEVLANAILDCKIVLFLASKNSYESKFTNSELTFAFNEKPKNSVLPYIIDASTMPLALRFVFSSINRRTIKSHPIDTVLINDILLLLGDDGGDKECERQKFEEEKRKFEEERKRKVTHRQSEEEMQKYKERDEKLCKTNEGRKKYLLNLWSSYKKYLLIIFLLLFSLLLGIYMDLNNSVDEPIIDEAINDKEACLISGRNNGHGYVDLGLSVKWSTCNVGASMPEGYGNYFAWGETSPKNLYFRENYKYMKGSSYTITKYCTDSEDGMIDLKSALELSDDVARVIWGGSWRIPTDEELNELRNTLNCTWTWTSKNGVKGYKVTSKINGNSIFLPAAGYRAQGTIASVGSSGHYWSSSLNTVNSYEAINMRFYEGVVEWGINSRYYGFPVRAVCE